MSKRRSPLQVSDNFLIKLKELQRKIRMKTGNERSLRELTDDLVSSSAFKDIEKNILDGDVDVQLNIKFDKRWLK